jgi:hypothetical protein
LKATGFAVSTVFAAVAVSTPAAAETWKVEQVAPRLTQFAGVGGSSKENVFAVGNRGAIFRFDGSRWAQQKSGTDRDLTAVWAGSSSSAFAVGLDGVIVEYNGKAWETRTSGTKETLLDVWGASPSDVFAVGRDGTILHYDGNGWSPQTSGTTYDLTAVWGSSPTDVHVAGDHGTLLHYDGRYWTQKFPSFGWHWTFTALGGTSTSNVLAAGWRRPSGELRTEREGVLLRFDGESWKSVKGGETQIVDTLWAAAGETLLVGTALNGLSEIRRFDGDEFRRIRSEGRFDYRDIWRAPTGEVFVAGTTGFVLRNSGD